MTTLKKHFPTLMRIENIHFDNDNLIISAVLPGWSDDVIIILFNPAISDSILSTIKLEMEENGVARLKVDALLDNKESDKLDIINFRLVSSNN